MDRSTGSGQFYKWRARPCSGRDWSDAHTTNLILDIHADDPEFGYRFIADELEGRGHRSCERRVWRLCRQRQVWSTTTKKGRRGSGRTLGPAVHDDLVPADVLGAGARCRVTDRRHRAPHHRGEALLLCHCKRLLAESSVTRSTSA